jgi:alpha-tubulin suppressor-like RCC1 family protein
VITGRRLLSILIVLANAGCTRPNDNTGPVRAPQPDGSPGVIVDAGSATPTDGPARPGDAGPAPPVADAAPDAPRPGDGPAAPDACSPCALPPAISIAAGTAHTCAVLTGGKVVCWGNGGSGQLNAGATFRTAQPLEVVGVEHAVRVVAGDQHSCALLEDGTVRCWGTLGNLIPKAAAGHPHATLGDVTAITSGFIHACVLVGGGAARCWGGNYNGQLGDGTTTTSVTPVTVAASDVMLSIAAGGDDPNDGFTCAQIRLAGPLSIGAHCWGAGESGQLGDGKIASSTQPVRIQGVSNGVVNQGGQGSLAAGGGHACMLVGGGAVCWGANQRGAIGDGTTTNAAAPAAVKGLRDARFIAAGDGFTCAVLDDGAIKCWGNNGSGQLGNGRTLDALEPTSVSVPLRARAVACGGAHTCALREDGGVSCWGSNTSGQLGDGLSTDRPEPAPVLGW